MSNVSFNNPHRKNNNIEVLDLDGTLTLEDCDKIGSLFPTQFPTASLWNLITKELVTNKNEFDQKAADWKHMITTTEGIDKIASSKEMTECGLKFFWGNNQNSDAIRKKAAEIAKLLIENDIVIKKSIEYLRLRLSQGITCVISTASYEDGAIGFVDELVAQSLLPATLARNIIFSGTTVDWHSLKVTHMNVGMNKLEGLEISLQEALANLKPKIKAVFGDDPTTNDYGLLNFLCKHSFVIKTAKNIADALPANCVFADWEEIVVHADNLAELHKQKVAEKHFVIRSKL